MPRTSRAVIDGGTYHVLTRGNNSQVVFHEDSDCQRYLQLLATQLREHGLKMYHFALMPNHVHLVLEVPNGRALSKAMLGLNLTYALYHHRRYQSSGHLWQGRFKSLLVDREAYLVECGRYVELNPVRAGLVRDPGAYPWSSYRVYANGVDNPLVAPNPLYVALGGTARERQQRYRQFVHDRLQQELETGLQPHQATRVAASSSSWAGWLGSAVHRRRRGRPRKPTATARRKIETSPFLASDEK